MCSKIDELEEKIDQLVKENKACAVKLARLEERIISTISKEKSVVVATGGGAVLSEKNRKIFHENYTFFLDCDRDIIKERLKDRTILPDRGFKEVSQLWKERKQYYKEFENLILDAEIGRASCRERV